MWYLESLNLATSVDFASFLAKKQQQKQEKQRKRSIAATQ